MVENLSACVNVYGGIGDNDIWAIRCDINFIFTKTESIIFYVITLFIFTYISY
jgi:hypothetical protein